MSSPATSALASGFSVLLAMSGEALTLQRQAPLGNALLTGLVDRNLERTKRKLEINFDPERATQIEITAGAVTPIPRVGESFRDAFNTTHRILRVQPVDGLVLRCRCETN